MFKRLAFSVALAAAAWCAPLGAAFAQGFSVTIQVDENGNGTLSNTGGFNGPLQFGLANDPGPGGLSNVLTYDLSNPPGLTAGDVFITEPDLSNVVGDVIRFNPTQVIFGDTGTLLFYSANFDGIDSLADTISPPGSNYPNTVTISEINGTGTYTPTVGQPGYVSGAAGPVTYLFVSDVPEPASMALLATGLVALAWRRRHKLS